MGYTAQGLPFATGSHTSHKAAVSVAATRKTKTARYLRHLAQHGPQTDHEAATALGLPLSSINSIRNGAASCGLVGRGVAERPSVYGRACATWMLTAAGTSAVEKMRKAK